MAAPEGGPSTTKRVFTASLATETNTFSPLPVSLEDFREMLLTGPGQHPETPTIFTGPIVASRRRAAELGWTLVEGTCACSAPGGLVSRRAHERLRDAIVAEVEAALPLDAVVLGLHGAMVAHGCDDCEGDLLKRIRERVGPSTLVAAEFDPHCHWTQAMATSLDVAVFYKEFPHTDFYTRAEVLVDIVARALRGEVSPKVSTFDARMIDVFPTTREPMRGLVDSLDGVGGDDRVLDVSIVHGFRAGDVAEMGTKVVVVTDDAADHGVAVAERVAKELFDRRGTFFPPMLKADEAIAAAKACPRRPVVLADVWSNPGGGVPGDNTFLLKALLAAGVANAALGTIWDPMAVRACHAAGAGATMPLRFGGKSCAGIGDPVDAVVTVESVHDNGTQTFAEAVDSLGPCAVVRVGGVEVVLNTNRTQVFDPTLFTNLGIPATERDILVVKSTNHFYLGFAKISKDIMYVECPGVYPSDYHAAGYTKVRRPLWPLDGNLAWSDVVREQSAWAASG